MMPEQPTPPDDGERIRQNVAKMRAQGATDTEVESYLTGHEGLKPHAAVAPTPTRGGMVSTTSRTGAALQGLAQGATLGYADEALGGIGALNHIAPKWLGGEGAPNSEFGDSYRRIRDQVRAGDNAGSAAHGGIHLAGSLMGGVLPFAGGGAASLVKSGLGKALGEGAAIGGVAGFGNAQGSGAEQAQGAISGAALGAAGTGVLRGAGYLGGKVIDAVGRSRVASAIPGSSLLDANGQAKRIILQKLASGGKSIGDIAGDAAQPVHQGQPTTLADLGGDAVARVARGVQSRPDQSAMIRDAFEGRQRGQLGRIKQAGSEHLGIDPENVQETAAAKLKEAQDASAPHFAKVEAHGPVDDPAIDKTLKQPFFSTAYSDAKKYGLVRPDQQKPVMQTITNPATMKPLEMDGVPLLDPSGQPKMMVPDQAATTTTKETPTAWLLHRTKLNMDNHVSGASPLRGEPVTSGGSGSSDNRDLTGGLQQFNARLREIIPGYPEALDTYAPPMRERESLLNGGKAFQGEIRPPEIQHMAGQADSKPYFQRGAWNELLQKAGSVPDRNGEIPRDVAHVFNGTPNIRAAMGHAFGEAPGYPDLTNALSRESLYSKTGSDILSGSRTVPLLQDANGVSGGAPPVRAAMSAARITDSMNTPVRWRRSWPRCSRLARGVTLENCKGSCPSCSSSRQHFSAPRVRGRSSVVERRSRSGRKPDNL